MLEGVERVEDIVENLHLPDRPCHYRRQLTGVVDCRCHYADDRGRIERENILDGLGQSQWLEQWTTGINVGGDR